ncbi:type II secretion system protein N [Thauera butanivorans]|uniref:type II secretion system protein N n=1 Tax=Thauera butanivorans TaxID=86174 RepID=UPI00083935D8|nr:type II secretion system protein N [Thauera butanivorans]
MQWLGNHRGWTAVVESAWLPALAWLLSLGLVAWLAAGAFWAWRDTPPLIALPQHDADPRSVAAKIMRHAGGAPSASAAAATQAAAPPFTLVGLATGFGSERGFALFETVDGQRRAVLAGDGTAEGWTLIAIRPDRVVLERAGRTVELALAEARSPDSSDEAPSRP